MFHCDETYSLLVLCFHQQHCNTLISAPIITFFKHSHTHSSTHSTASCLYLDTNKCCFPLKCEHSAVFKPSQRCGDQCSWSVKGSWKSAGMSRPFSQLDPRTAAKAVREPRVDLCTLVILTQTRVQNGSSFLFFYGSLRQF